MKARDSLITLLAGAALALPAAGQDFQVWYAGPQGFLLTAGAEYGSSVAGLTSSQFNPFNLVIGGPNFGADAGRVILTSTLAAADQYYYTGESGWRLGEVVAAGGDVNLDGRLDFAVANSGSDDVSVLLGNGDGTFQSPRHFAVGTRPVSLAVGDINRDGRLDLAVANEGMPFPYAPLGSVSVLLGNGDGTFGGGWNYIETAWTRPGSVVLADSNGDGFLDLAVGISLNIRVFLGNGDGTFQSPRTFAVASTARSLAAADVNGDSRPDLIMTVSIGVSVLLSNGDGTFQAARSFAGGDRSLVLGDFNGDHILDLAAASEHGNNVGVLLGHGDGTFQAAPHFAAGDGPLAVAIGDVNGDGIPDLTVANSGSRDVSVLLGNGDGTFQGPRNFAGIGSPVILGDVNNDGFPDIVMGLGVVSVLLGYGDGTFGPPRTVNIGLQNSSITLGDVNGDGRLDLIATISQPGTVRVLLGNGDGTFGVPWPFAAGTNPTSAVVGDLSGDGFLDIVVVRSTPSIGTVSVLLGNGDGTFGFPPLQFPVGAGPRSLVLAELNGDGVLDLVVANTYSNNVGVLLGNGDGTFQTMRTFAAGREPLRVVVGDINGDRFLDIAVSTGAVRLLLGDGDGTFQTTNVSYIAGGLSVALGEFNSDPFLDAVTTNSIHNGVSIVLNARASPCLERHLTGVVGCDTHRGAGGDSTAAPLGIFPPEPATLNLRLTQPAAASPKNIQAVSSGSATPSTGEHAAVMPAPDEPLATPPRSQPAVLLVLGELFAELPFQLL